MTVIIQNLTFETIIGLLPHEREIPQRVVIDAEFDINENTMVLDYASVSEDIKRLFTCKGFETVEESLTLTLSHLKSKYPFITRIKMKIIKPDILCDCEVGAALEKKY